MARKYLKGGALNPIWCDEQDAAYEAEMITDSMGLLYNIFNEMDINFDFHLGEVADISISNNKPQKNMCTIVNIENDYEAKFNFIKNHSGTPEDLQLAREIVGLK